MNDIEKRAHDIALAFVSCYVQKEGPLDSPEHFADDYREAYERILKWLNKTHE